MRYVEQAQRSSIITFDLFVLYGYVHCDFPFFFYCNESYHECIYNTAQWPNLIGYSIWQNKYIFFNCCPWIKNCHFAFQKYEICVIYVYKLLMRISCFLVSVVGCAIPIWLYTSHENTDIFSEIQVTIVGRYFEKKPHITCIASHVLTTSETLIKKATEMVIDKEVIGVYYRQGTWLNSEN